MLQIHSLKTYNKKIRDTEKNKKKKNKIERKQKIECEDM